MSPGQTFTAILQGAPEGIASELGLKAINVDSGATVVGPIAAGGASGVVEQDPPSGHYRRPGLVAPDEAMTFQVVWTHGAVEIPDSEVIVVTYTPPVAPGAGLYVSPPAVREVLAPEGQNDQSTAAQLSDDALVEQIVAAQREIDGRLSDRYSTPFETGEVPGLVYEIARDIAAFLATLTHRRAGEVADDETVRVRYTRAKELLELVADGKIDLEVPGDGEAVSAEPTVINPRDHDLFSEAEELGSIPTYLS